MTTTSTSNEGDRSSRAVGTVDATGEGSQNGRPSTGRWSDIVSDPKKVQPWLARLAGVPAFGLIVVTVYGFAVKGAVVVAVGFIVAGGAFMIGALLGFLFGVPRALTGSGREPGVRSNTNLEQISDWLTKILVGVGLVELGQLAHSCSRLVRFLAPALGGAPSSQAFAAGVLVFFTSTGFMIGYVITRAVVGPLFAQTEWVISSVDTATKRDQPPEPLAETAPTAGEAATAADAEGGV